MMTLGGLLGKTILVELCCRDSKGTLLEERQLFGKVVEAGPDKGVRLRLPDGNHITLPPEPLSIRQANAGGDYRLWDTGEAISPDFIWRWTLSRPEAHILTARKQQETTETEDDFSLLPGLLSLCWSGLLFYLRWRRLSKRN